MSFGLSLQDILSAGVDTSSSTVEWALAELITKPTVLEKLQAEIDSYVGNARSVEERDLAHLPYLDAVVKETFRLHPPAPLLLPHESIEPCNLLGYNIPSKTRRWVNVWAIGRDPAEWETPLEFLPERFVGSEIDARGQDFRFLPFGSGRRMCPGITLGMAMVQLTLSRLVQSFDFSLPFGKKLEDLDMSETFGLTVTRSSPLQLTALPRLLSKLYNN
jgi:cytochrome P450